MPGEQAGSTPSESNLGLPDGWSRVQAREGRLGSFTENPTAGFTIDLPPGWSATEGRPFFNDGLHGWITSPESSSTEKRPYLRYRIGVGPRGSLDAIPRDPRYAVTELEIEGVAVVIRLATPDAVGEGLHIEAFYEQIPGAPDGVIAPSLDIDGDSRGFDDQELLGRILRSVRYSEVSSPPEIPSAAEIDTTDWVKTFGRSEIWNARWGAANFTVRVPPGWTVTSGWGMDSAIGTIAGDGIELSYDFFRGVIDPSDQRWIEPGLPEHLVWEEMIDGVKFSFVRPISGEPDPRATTGATIKYPAFRDDGSATYQWIPISVAGLNGDQQELALTVLRTLRGVPYVVTE